MAGAALLAAACLVVAVALGTRAWADQTRAPTAAERAAASAAAVAGRWRTWPAGRIFPGTIGYVSDVLTQEKAQRAGISPADGCPAALEGVLAAVAQRDGCRAALRATYLDQLQGVAYTTGVLVFPTPGRAAAFAHAVAWNPLPAGLRAYSLTGTAIARFGDPARQSAVAEQSGPYVVLTVAGYADGRPASATGQRRPAIFAPARQVAQEILAPLSRPVKVNCASREWTC
jgi:hypothetical protein